VTQGVGLPCLSLSFSCSFSSRVVALLSLFACTALTSASPVSLQRGQRIPVPIGYQPYGSGLELGKMHPSRFDPAGPSGRHDFKGRDFHRPRPGETPERTNFHTPTKGSRKTGLTSPIGASPHLGSDRTRSRDDSSSRSDGAGSAGALSDHSPAASVVSSASTMWYDANGTAPGLPQRDRPPELPTISEGSPVAAATSPGPGASGSSGTGEVRHDVPMDVGGAFRNQDLRPPSPCLSKAGSATQASSQPNRPPQRSW